ncbi:ribosomal protein S5 domain 2-like protein [Podospora appendiculata]|uniref:Ribosomal RNA-processing protein 43 n=1 Tax=Podospora appendiculata TaxID=314037 RepID=A0AAE1CHK7_9PEZI|nr:ribosomal protein S5 domain 2-like protein [Podospora appendiculata]
MKFPLGSSSLNWMYGRGRQSAAIRNLETHNPTSTSHPESDSDLLHTADSYSSIMAIPSLSFSRPTFAKLSPHPYLLTNLSPQSPSTKPSRTNGRAPHEARPVQIHTSSLSHAHGSALVRSGNTTVVCGVRAEILPVTNIPQYRPRSSLQPSTTASDEAADRAELKAYDLLVPNIELATGCAPQFLPGVPPSTLAQTLSTRVYSLLHSCGVVDPKSLRIWHDPSAEAKKTTGEGDASMQDDNDDDESEAEPPQLMAYWVLYIDLLFVSFDGNPFDAAWTAVMAALRDTKLPEARWDPDREMAICSRTRKNPLDVSRGGLPVACTAAVFQEKEYAEAGGLAGENRHWVLLDPDRLEESLCRETVTMVVDCGGVGGETRIRSIEKQGGTVIGRELMRGFAGVAEKRWREVRDAMQ